jgi:hypothetical protein
MTTWPYPPSQPSGDWQVALPGDASIGEVLLYDDGPAAPPDFDLGVTQYLDMPALSAWQITKSMAWSDFTKLDVYMVLGANPSLGTQGGHWTWTENLANAFLANFGMGCNGGTSPFVLMRDPSNTLLVNDFDVVFTGDYTVDIMTHLKIEKTTGFEVTVTARASDDGGTTWGASDSATVDLDYQWDPAGLRSDHSTQVSPHKLRGLRILKDDVLYLEMNPDLWTLGTNLTHTGIGGTMVTSGGATVTAW